MTQIQRNSLAIIALSMAFGFAAIARGAPAATQPGSDASSAGDLSNLSLEDLMNVQVTSVSKTKQSIADAPAAVTVISQDDIARSGFSTIPDLLRLVPGMDVARLASSSWAISARGLNGQFANDLLVLQDGRTLYTPLFAGVYWDTVDYLLPDLDRIEVIRGPGATLWGSNAVNGVVNIISKDAKDTQGFLLDSRASVDGEDNLGIRYGGQLDDNTYYRVYGKARYTDESITDTGTDAGDDWAGLKGGFRIDKHSSDDDTFTLQGDLGSNRLNTIQSVPSFIAPFAQQQQLAQVDVSNNLLASWNHRVDDNSDFSLQAYYDYLNVEYGYKYSQNTFDLDFHDRLLVGSSNELTWGLGYRFVNGEFASSDLVSFSPTSNENLYSAFLQDTITIAPKQWFLTLGSKIEHNDYTGFEFEPSARLMWTPDEHNTVWGAISRAVHTPTQLEEDASIVEARFQQPVGGGATLPAQADILGDTNSQSEELIAYELGYRFQPIKQVSVDIATFYNNYNKLASLETGVPPAGVPLVIPLQFANKLHGDSWGGEIGSTLEVTSQWRLSGSYSLLEVAFESEPGSTDTISAGRDDGAAPENQFQVHSSLDVTKNVQFNTAVYYVGRVPLYDVPSYLSTDLNVSWQIKEGVVLQVGILNLFDPHHSEYGILPDNAIASETPRTIYAELSYKF